ncbi:HNH endonuclease [Marinobacter sp. 2_MG-2023]|uniref:HNH endonuclease n=1 Tax=Marinobacter sp. 2_MG-2023 TaxID=3062679 RepID=UPI0026E215C6|nr:HNH endonuclease [Marinobacter sp. 2_MG-2023]MDO6441562.1 HNH endonuclease [Marinobacter sp. 2_MG-2023]
MAVNFEYLVVGQEYERPFLAELWGYKGYQAISRGVVTPSRTNFIILFVTKEKQQALTQYNDYIDGDYLHWEGEEKHSSDSRIISASASGDEIHLLYRDIHHSPFVYYGQISLRDYELHTNEPSKFVFSLALEGSSPDPIADIEKHKGEYSSLEKTERESVVKSRVGQGLFRHRVIELWGSCSVTGLANLSLLRASHIKPWRDCSNQERLDPMNGLLLHPTLDHLFDSGLVTFEENGKIRLSDRLSAEDAEILQLDSSETMRKVPGKLKEYMKFHRDHVFKKG